MDYPVSAQSLRRLPQEYLSCSAGLFSQQNIHAALPHCVQRAEIATAVPVLHLAGLHCGDHHGQN